MTLNDVSASLAFSVFFIFDIVNDIDQTTELAELNFAGSAIFYFSKSNDTVSVSLQASSDFQDVTLTAQVLEFVDVYLLRRMLLSGALKTPVKR